MLAKSMVAGCAIFSMLFGSGNIVFPLILGKIAAGNWTLALVGWLIAAVLIPMIGFYGAMLFDADYKKYLAPMGKYLTAILMFIIMNLVGPFGVIARIVNVSFGGINNLAPQMPLVVFSAIYVLLTVILAYKPDKVVGLIGKIFTPLKFGGLAVIVIGALYFGESFSYNCPNPIEASFLKGFNMGYQTMDLLGCLLFSGSIYYYIKNAMPKEDINDKKKLLNLVGIACVIGSVMLAIAYAGLLLIGVQYSAQLSMIADEAILGKIAELSMGTEASWFVSIVIAVSCLATAVVLCSVFTDYVYKDLLKEKFNRTIILFCVGLLAFAMSLLGFGKICSILGMILEKVYPALMVFIGIRIVYYYAVINKK
jgi:LIVCS family branched-chain amino acid:cation transporter